MHNPTNGKQKQWRAQCLGAFLFACRKMISISRRDAKAGVRAWCSGCWAQKLAAEAVDRERKQRELKAEAVLG